MTELGIENMWMSLYLVYVYLYILFTIYKNLSLIAV